MEPIPEPESALEKACLDHGLVLRQTLQKWRDLYPDHSFCSLVGLQAQRLPEDPWIEMISNYPGLPPYFPTTDQTRLSPFNWTDAGQTLTRELFACLLQDQPLLVVALLNPFAAESVVRWLGRSFPEHQFALVSTTPAAFSNWLKLLELPPTPVLPAFEAESLEEWCHHLNFEASSFLHSAALVEDLWLHRPQYPVLTPGDHSQALPIPGEPDSLLLRQTATHAWVASRRATDEALLDRLYQKLGRRIHLLAIGPREFARLQSCSPAPPAAQRVATFALVVRDWDHLSGPTDDEAHLFHALLAAAIRLEASDIHLEPKPTHIQVRFRLDGELRVQSPLTKPRYPSLLRRIKILAGLRQDKTGIVQDGALRHVQDGQRYDLRVAITVLQDGEETVVLRIFSSILPQLADLHLPPREQRTLQWFLDQENGLLLVSGPTGSGKTTTLYACLRALAQPQVSVVTIEQPVEKYLPAAKQIEVGENDGPHRLTFVSALRSVLRQDPDVIMIGEIRDAESAAIAVQAALTGHQVLSSVHANDAVGVMERLCGSFGVDRLALGYALKLSVAQRLVSRLCPHCRRTHPATPEELRAFPEIGQAHPVISVRVGCPACRGTGNIGRIALMEMLPVDSEITSLIEQKASPREIRLHNQQRGFTPLLHQATSLLLQGEISLPEARSFLLHPPFEIQI